MIRFLLLLLIIGVSVAAGAANRAVIGETFRKSADVGAAGAFELRLGRGAWIMGVVCGVVIPLALGWVALYRPPRSEGQMTPLLLLIFGFATLGWIILAAAAREWARVSLDGIEGRPMVGRTQQVRWEDITSVRFSSLRGNLTFYGRNGELVQVPIMAIGLPQLVEEMDARLNPAVYENALRRALGQILPYAR